MFVSLLRPLVFTRLRFKKFSIVPKTGSTVLPRFLKILFAYGVCSFSCMASYSGLRILCSIFLKSLLPIHVLLNGQSLHLLLLLLYTFIPCLSWLHFINRKGSMGFRLLPDHPSEPDKAFLAVVLFFLAYLKYVIELEKNQSPELISYSLYLLVVQHAQHICNRRGFVLRRHICG